MRIEPIQSECAAVDWTAGLLSVGSAPDNDLVLADADVAAHHVQLSRDARGLVMTVAEDAPRVYVNARPVREKAMLRAGDTLGLGTARLRLVADSVPQPDAPPESDARAVVALRALAGPLSGQVFPLTGPLLLGRDGAMLAADARAFVRLQRWGRNVRLDVDNASARHNVRANGIEVTQALLHDGDQLVWGAHHYVLDVSVEPAAVQPSTERAMPASDTTTSASRRLPPELWLVATAALLALVLALVLWSPF